MKKFNLAEIMTKAWAIFRKATDKTFSECLKKAWALAKAVVNFASTMNKMLDAYLTVTDGTEISREINEDEFYGKMYLTDTMGRTINIVLAPKKHSYIYDGCGYIPKETLQKMAALVKA